MDNDGSPGLAVTYPNIKSKMAEILDESAKKTKDRSKKSLQLITFVIRLRQKNNYPLEMIANMNVTLVWFDMAGGLTVNPKDAKTVPIRTTENDKNRFTIVLMCFANSRKLLPIIIFKEKGWPANAPRPLTDIVVWFQEKGWMDELGMTHITDWAKAEFRSGNTDLAVIPGGLMRNLKCASLNMVYHWVLNTWNKISENNIVRAFKKYGISNCLSGSEGHLIYATNDESDEDKIEDFNDSKKEKFDEDNEDKEFDENEEFNEIKESDKDAECDGDESDSDEMMVMNLIIGLASGQNALLLLKNFVRYRINSGTEIINEFQLGTDLEDLFLKRRMPSLEAGNSEIAEAIQFISAEETCIIRQLLEIYPKISEKQLKEIQEKGSSINPDDESEKRRRQSNIEALLLTECSTSDYGTQEVENTFSKQEERDNRRISEKDSPREEAETMSMMIEENSGELKEKEQANSMQLDKNREIREKVTESLETYTLWDIPRNFNNCRIKTLMRRYGKVANIAWISNSFKKRAVEDPEEYM
ncbi:hypothetical protein C2G38_2206250 [Gigaspora rosea]|uniref:DDE-1 domain-containing protein n=1 Tax=Gigaspora rosea TaxID=44941 RepID=A0A397UMB4_9GLOM|nr:hypothetical protein C2G38_2206250 [Gigaspora rosea]